MNTDYRHILAKSLCLCAFLLFGTQSHAAAKRDIVVNLPSSEHHRYCMGLLKLALSYHSDKYNLVIRDKDSGNQARELQELLDGDLQITWWATSNDLETKTSPIRVPLYRGLLGHRVFIIHNDKQHEFDDINSMEDLKQIKLGQGLTWADTEILESNDLTVVKTAKYNGLFHMLDGGRFQAFPRGVHEPWSEVSSRPDLDLSIEKKLMLVYKMPMYFFASNQDKTLADDIENALLTAIDDGSFNRYFMGNDMIQDVLKKANLSDRVSFNLTNPRLPEKTPLDVAKLWLDPSTL